MYKLLQNKTLEIVDENNSIDLFLKQSNQVSNLVNEK